MTKRGGLLFLGIHAEAGDQGPCQKVDEEEVHDVGRYYCYDSDWAAAAAALWTYGRLKLKRIQSNANGRHAWRACESKKLKRVRWQHPEDGSLPL